MQLVANRPLTGTDVRGNKYRADPGEQFEIYDDAAMKLIRRGVASCVRPPGVPAMITGAPAEIAPPSLAREIQAKVIGGYETKVIIPQERKRGRGRPGTPTACPKCREICPSARAAQRHCKETTP